MSMKAFNNILDAVADKFCVIANVVYKEVQLVGLTLIWDVPPSEKVLLGLIGKFARTGRASVHDGGTSRIEIDLN